MRARRKELSPIHVLETRSRQLPYIVGTCPRDQRVIEWADKHPHVWSIVTTNKSAAFGKKSCAYIGWAQGSDAPEAILERAKHLFMELYHKNYPADPIWRWRLEFTLQRFRDKGFKGGFFQLWDGRYDRSCMYLDYTPETREEVIDRFLAWCDKHYDKVAVKIDGEIVRRIEQE